MSRTDRASLRRRPVPTRATAALLAALWLATAAGDLLGGHGCPHHDRLPAPGAAGGSHHPAKAAGVSGHAGHPAGTAGPGLGGHAGGQADPAAAGGGVQHAAEAGRDGAADADAGDHADRCTCLGACHAGAGAPHMAAAGVRLGARATESIARPAPPAADHRRPTLVLIPFANGPPAS